MTSHTRIGRQFQWEMGHRLQYHDGACRNLHGHSYRLWVELEGACDKNGMLLDYAELKRRVQPVIEPLDHCFLCDESDLLMAEFLRATPFKSVFVPFPTTAENLVRYLLDRIWILFREETRIRRLSLRLSETETSFAEVSHER